MKRPDGQTNLHDGIGPQFSDEAVDAFLTISKECYRTWELARLMEVSNRIFCALRVGGMPGEPNLNSTDEERRDWIRKILNGGLAAAQDPI